MRDITLSTRMAHTVVGLLPGVDATVNNRASTVIDLATAENWLIRDDLELPLGVRDCWSISHPINTWFVLCNVLCPTTVGRWQ